MKKRHIFYLCTKCGNLIGLVQDKGVPLVCCSREMKELVPNTFEASEEKHLPAVTVTGDIITVQVGSTLHPMDAEHLITFVYVETENGGQRKGLKAGDEPILSFCFMNDKPIAVYAYCNLHGIWKTDVK